MYGDASKMSCNERCTDDGASAEFRGVPSLTSAGARSGHFRAGVADPRKMISNFRSHNWAPGMIHDRAFSRLSMSA